MEPQRVAAQVSLTVDQIKAAGQLADESYATWKSVRGHYRNTPKSHRIGKLGEVGFERWLESSEIRGSIDPAFRDPGRAGEADVLVESIRLEIKTWDSQWWEPWGRCVTPQQLPSIRRKADKLVWCHWDEARSLLTVEGWSAVDDIAALPITMTGPNTRQVANHQLHVNQIRSLDGLCNAPRGPLQ